MLVIKYLFWLLGPLEFLSSTFTIILITIYNTIVYDTTQIFHLFAPNIIIDFKIPQLMGRDTEISEIVKMSALSTLISAIGNSLYCSLYIYQVADKDNLFFTIPGVLQLVIIPFVLMTFIFDSGVISYREIRCLSLLGVLGTHRICYLNPVHFFSRLAFHHFLKKGLYSPERE